MSHWTKEFFIEKGEFFLRIMNQLWDRGEKTAKAIISILNKHGIYSGKILDMCCGNGRISIPLARRGFKVIGVDISPLFISDAVKKAEKYGVCELVEFKTGDVRMLKNLIDESEFDAVINVWTSIGYYDDETDYRIFKQARELTRPNGLLIIAATACKEFIYRNFSPIGIEEFGDIVILHYREIDVLTATVRDKWVWYERKNHNLKYLDETTVSLRIYSLNEISSILRRAGWEVKEAYENLIEKKPINPQDIKGINIIAKAV